MTPIILNTIDLNQIRILESKRYEQNHYVWPIQYNTSNMCFQTSYLHMVKYNKDYNNISLSTYYNPVQSSKKIFIKTIRDIDKKIVQLLSVLKKKIKYKKKILYRKSYVTQNNYMYYNFSLQQCNKNIMCNVYDEHKQLQSIDYIEPGCDVYSILWLKNIWLKNNKAGVNYVIIQLKVYKPVILINTCLIIEDKDIFVEECSTKKPNKNNQQSDSCSVQPEYQIYFKMKKMGVPIQAIQMKMTLAGHDPTILTSILNKDISNNKTNNQVSIHNQILQSSTRMSPMDLLHGIRNKKLKKKKKISEQTRKQNVLKRLGVLSRQNGIPTLEEILQTRNRLKKIK